MNKLLLALPLVLLAGCATTSGPATTQSVGSQSLMACKGLKALTVTMTSLKPQMPASMQSEVGLSLNTAAGYCTTPTPPANANQIVLGITNSLNSLADALAQQKIAAQKAAASGTLALSNPEAPTPVKAAMQKLKLATTKAQKEMK